MTASTSTMPELNAVYERLTDLERQFDELRSQVMGAKPRDKNWQRTAGSFPRDEATLEAERLGHEWRAQSVDWDSISTQTPTLES